eukprot:352348-Chlamydomonas_euryale.AAC.1
MRRCTQKHPCTPAPLLPCTPGATCHCPTRMPCSWPPPHTQCPLAHTAPLSPHLERVDADLHFKQLLQAVWSHQPQVAILCIQAGAVASPLPAAQRGSSGWRAHGAAVVGVRSGAAAVGVRSGAAAVGMRSGAAVVGVRTGKQWLACAAGQQWLACAAGQQ